jgi:hypothetical protein
MGFKTRMKSLNLGVLERSSFFGLCFLTGDERGVFGKMNCSIVTSALDGAV